MTRTLMPLMGGRVEATVDTQRLGAEDEIRLLVMTRGVRDLLLDGVLELHQSLKELRSEGVQCEVSTCRERSQGFLEQSEDDGRNLCGHHLDFADMIRSVESGVSAVRLIWTWDDGTRTSLKGALPVGV